MIAIDTKHGRLWVNLDRLDYAADRLDRDEFGGPSGLELRFGNGSLIVKGEQAQMIRAELDFRAEEAAAEEALYRETLARSMEKGGGQ